ncbi:hypothetical protein [Paenibacillus polymyxa]|uniref:hypothetical protein n=1 Tax=Paenibacillus polymyxa TaxID=1406 RepID=UPI0019D6A355|nr:hypothetical protein [Paenibacillus polymyxa]
MKKFRDMWRQGKSVEQIRKHFKRDSWQEVIIIALDQIRWGYIKIRPDVLIVE